MSRGTYNTDKKRNRFLKLRFEDGASMDDSPFISARDLAKKRSISTGKISQLEDESLKDFNPITKERGDVPTCKASVLRIYHDEFNCSYDYLMGETNNRKIEYAEIGKDPILSNLGDEFWDNLKLLLKDEFHQKENAFMINLLLKNPEALSNLFMLLIKTLHTINEVSSYNFSDSNIEFNTGALEYTLSSRFLQFAKTELLPHIEHIAPHYLEQEKKLEKATNEMFEHFNDFMRKQEAEPSE